ncbi:zinc finger protein 287-like [Topomyia yanbarensis]|uniref:zinc finger protein 287-like n=1 Tax=Topomyia yanbarensis TaxID=2498891 RepID=UPI00273BF941|nr:zinc finger protein 287-like [Topomyia yanbarensis]
MQKKPTRRDCFIPGCLSQMGQVVFMSAYKSDGLQSWWSETAWAQKRKNKQIPKNSRVCEKHFEEKYIDRSYKMPRLFPEAWPTMHVESPKPEELIGRPKAERSGGVKLETNPRIYCRLCGRKDKRPLENQLDQLKDGEAFLKYCLGQYYTKDYFPQGICENCMETAEYVLNFVKQCEQTQHRLERIFVPRESLKVETPYELLENISLKQEKEEDSEYVDEPPESPKALNVKPETFILTENGSEDEDYMAAEDERAVSSDSVQSDEEIKPNVATDDSSTTALKASRSRVSYDSDSGSDTDDKYSLKRKYKNKPGPKPRKAKENSEIIDELPASDQESDSGKPIRQPKQKRERSSTGAGETSRICPICGKILVHKGNFTSHLKIHSDKKDYVCNICGKQYYIRRELQMHIESLHEKKTFVCNICGIKCAWRKGLQRHMKNKHSDESSLKHKCTYCGKAFLLPNQLRLHIMKHTGDRITCDICGAGYRFNYMLTQHKIREHGMEFKGVKLYKTSSRSRKNNESKQATAAGSAVAAAIATITEPQSSSAPPSSVVQIVDSNHDSLLSSESSQSHHIQQQQQQQPPQQSALHHQQLQQYHHVAAAQLERIHYPPGFIYPSGGTPAMMLPPGGYSG